MLTYLRSRSRKWLKIIVFGAIIVVFVFWGGSTYWGREASKIAKIDRYIITEQQYNKAYADAIQNLQSRLGSAPTPDLIKNLNLKEKVLDQMIDEYVLDFEAEKLGVDVSDEELQKAIREFPPFQQDGRFDINNYRRVLSYQRLTPAQFEDQQRRMLFRQRVYALITENVIVTPEEVEASYKYQNDVLDLNYLTIDSQDYLKDITVTDTDAGIYYDKNKERYKIPPKVTLSYIHFASADYLKDVTVSEDEAQDYYDSHKAEFSTEPKVNGRHILIKVSHEADAALVKQKSEEALGIYNEIKAGADFAELAKKYSEDPGTNFIGGDIGFVPQSSLPEPMGKTLASMKPGEVRPPVRTGLGFHILKFEGKEEAKVTPFEEASESITNALKLKRAKILAGDDANNSFNALYEQGKSDLSAYAQSRGLEAKEFGPVARDEGIGIPNASEIMKNAFLYPKGELGSVVDTEDGYMIYVVKDKFPSRIPELSEIKDKVLADAKKSEALERAKAHAQDLAKDPGALAGTARHSTGEFTRTAYAVPQIGMVEGVREDLDKLGSPRTYVHGDKIYVVWIGKKKDADIKAADKTRLDRIEEELLSRKKEAAVEAFLKEARNLHKIEIDRGKLRL